MSTPPASSNESNHLAEALLDRIVCSAFWQLRPPSHWCRCTRLLAWSQAFTVVPLVMRSRLGGLSNQTDLGQNVLNYPKELSNAA